MGTDAPRSRRHRGLRAVFVTLGIVLTVALAGGGFAAWTVTRSFPTLSGELRVPGLGAAVTVYRDNAGIPLIEAKTAQDLFMAEGYVHAQDRFWEMDFRRHVTAGRLSELFGESQVGTDSFIRTLGWRAVAEAEVDLLDPVALGYYQAYADGVNAYLATHSGADISLEYAVLGVQNPGYKPQQWTPADSIAWLKAMAWDLRSNLDDEIDRSFLAASLPPEDATALHPAYPYAKNPTILGGFPDQAAAVAALDAVTGPPDDATGDTPDPGAVPGPGAVAAQTADTSGEPAALAPLARLRDALGSVPELLGPAGDGIGSNSWVVSGALTDTSKPILANDPHLGAAMPSVWYQVGLRCAQVNAECPFDVSGYSFSGMPGIVIGHNARVAWGFTNLGPDVADLYIEKVTGDNYELDGVQKPLVVRTERINVAGAASVTLDIRATEHGPIVSGIAGTPYAQIASDYPRVADLETTTAPEEGAPALEYQVSLQWTALTPGHTPSAIFALATASDWPSFRAAAELFEVPSQNLIYADVDGNIGYQAPGSIPIRKTGDGTLPVPGWTSANGWAGRIPFASLPTSYNPPSGYIVTANNAAVGTDYPYLITADWDLGYRASRITARLQALIDAGTPLTTRMMSDIQGDNYSSIAAELVPALLNVSVSGKAAKAQALLVGWDLTLDSDSAAAGYFNVVWSTLLHQLFDSKLPEGTHLTGGDRSFAVVSALLADPQSPWWTNQEVGAAGRDSMLARVLTRAADRASELMGEDPADWRWGRIHTLELRNASFGNSGIAPLEWLFNRGPYEVDGGASVVNAVSWDATTGYDATRVPSMRQVVSLESWDDSTWVNLTGASGHAFHGNYADQAPLWQRHETRPWRFTQAAVEEATVDTLTLMPTRGD
ncbi:MAG: penicillin amidase [Cryobacterium sp.]|nr:penicillin amidase [Cryobacterium sp.]